MVRSGRLTALSKPDGGVRGIVSGDVIRRLVARTIANSWEKQLSQPPPPTNTHCQPVQGVSALPMHSRDCALNPSATVTSIDGHST